MSFCPKLKRMALNLQFSLIMKILQYWTSILSFKIKKQNWKITNKERTKVIALT